MHESSTSNQQQQLEQQHICTECNKAFNRLEHLKRHRLSHFDNPEHTCQTCGRSFHRLDAFRRHQIIHSNNATRKTAQSTVDESGRIKTRQACQRCSRSKIKCNGQLPCQRCIKAKGVTCTYSKKRQGNVERYNEGAIQRRRVDSHTNNDVQIILQDFPARQDNESVMSSIMDTDIPIDLEQQDLIQSERNGFTEGVDEERSNSQHLYRQHIPSHDHLLSNYAESTSAGQVSHLVNQNAPQSDVENLNVPLYGSSAFFTDEYVPNTDLDWLFPELSPIDQNFDFFLASQATFSAPEGPMPDVTAEVQVTGADELHLPTNGPILQANSRTTTPLQILSEAAVYSSTSHDPSNTAENTPKRQSTRLQNSSVPRVSFANLREEDTNTHSNHSAHHQIPDDIYAVSRKNSFSEPADVSLKRNWPNAYFPATGGQPYLSTVFEPISDEIALIEDTCQVPEFKEASLRSIISICSLLPSQDQEAVKTVFSSIDLRSYNVMLQLYFEKFHPLFPFLHLPTFQPDKCSPFLLISLCAVGCSFSKMHQASRMSDWLIDVAHRLVRCQCDQNMFHARSISIIQSLLLCSVAFACSSNRRLFEHGEALHSALATMVRRSNLLEKRNRPIMEEDVEKSWKQWIDFETAKRTAWCCYIADIEIASCWKFNAIYSLHELRAELPCPENVWCANSAHIWVTIKLGKSVYLPDLHANAKMNGITGLSFTLEKKILALSMTGLSLSLMQLQNPVFSLNVGSGLQEFSETIFGMANSAACNSNDISSATSEALMRFGHLGSIISLLYIQDLGGRRGGSEAKLALQRISSIFEEEPKKAIMASILCGRIIYLSRSIPLRTTCSPNIFFYAALCLYAISHHISTSLQISTSSSVSTDSPSSQISKRSKRISLDDDQSIRLPDESDCSFQDTCFVLKGIGDISSPNAPNRILSIYSDILINEIFPRTHGIAKRLGALLENISIANNKI